MKFSDANSSAQRLPPDEIHSHYAKGNWAQLLQYPILEQIQPDTSQMSPDNIQYLQKVIPIFVRVYLQSALGQKDVSQALSKLISVVSMMQSVYPIGQTEKIAKQQAQLWENFEGLNQGSSVDAAQQVYAILKVFSEMGIVSPDFEVSIKTSLQNIDENFVDNNAQMSKEYSYLLNVLRDSSIPYEQAQEVYQRLRSECQVSSIIIAEISLNMASRAWQSGRYLQSIFILISILGNVRNILTFWEYPRVNQWRKQIAKKSSRYEKQAQLLEDIISQWKFLGFVPHEAEDPVIVKLR